LIARRGPRVPDSNPRFLGELVNDFHELFSPLFVERGERNAYDA
jgi:hypothetical protein